MKNTKIRNVILADILLLIVLFLASSTDLLIKEKETEVHKIAVMVDMPIKGQVDNFRAGAMKASADHHTDMNFINLSSWKKMEDKQAVLKKELDNGCKGVIIQAEKEQTAAFLLEAVPNGVPVLLYNVDMDAACIYGSVGSDLLKECELLTDAILQDGKSGDGVVLVETTSCGERTLMQHDQIQKNLEAKGIFVRRMQVDTPEEAMTMTKGISALLGRVFVSGDISVLQYLGEGCASSKEDLSVYGIGFHSGIRYLLEQSAISGTVVHRAYEAGYISVEKMVEILEKDRSDGAETVVESVLVTPETMYLPQIESVIFPYI